MAKIAVTCNECGKKFKAANPERCPNCRGVDLDVAYVSVRVVPASAPRKVVFRNFPFGPFDFAEVA